MSWLQELCLAVLGAGALYFFVGVWRRRKALFGKMPGPGE